MEEQTTPTVVENTAVSRVERVVYLLGAGATQGCISHMGSPTNVMMSGLAQPIFADLRRKARDLYPHHSGIRRLVNEVISQPGLDIEHLITFLDDSSTQEYRAFSADLRATFSSILRDQLERIERDLGKSHSLLYAALIDMHAVTGGNESLNGFLTLNYDNFLEHAIESLLARQVDYGVAVSNASAPAARDARPVRVLKLHGSFGWSQEWPMKADRVGSAGVWIPPGLRKPKTDYPFNAIWGLARELLDCEVLRIVGCNLGSNDWDLVSLLFSTRHTHATAPPYRVEVISDYETADRIRSSFPYLDVLWLPDLPKIGEQIVSELVGGEPRLFADLPESLQQQVIGNAKKIKNPFEFWLTQMGEAMAVELGILSTGLGIFQKFVDDAGR
jgi:hypothetical protein